MSEYSNDFYMQLNRTSQATIFAMTIGAKAVIGLMQFLMRLHREGILSGGEVERFEQFVKATEGKYEIYSVPLLQGQEQETLESIKAKLDALVSRYEEKKMRLAELQERKADAEATGEVLCNFIHTLRGIGDMVTEFDDSLWAGLVESMTVYGKEEATFIFKGGTEIRVKKSD